MDKDSGQEVACQVLQIARESVRLFVLHRQFYQPELAALPPWLGERMSSFVTVYRGQELRGCIGSTGARYPLAVDVARNAAAAARDPRFPPVRPPELSLLTLEVSVLRPALPLAYEDYKDLLEKLRPGKDGVIISWQEQRALLLPQVWVRLPEPAEFLHALCRKARIPLQLLQAMPPAIRVLTFEADYFKEDEYEIDWK